ncbi:MBL fold metallo-hydrolase [Pelomyxa schiedti]|nr:MBL fold metallo-hydrolase [Pelomyxa schiedti]
MRRAGRDFGALEVITIPVRPLSANCSIISNKATKECLITDCGGEAQNIVTRIKAASLRPIGALFTHGHFDHTMSSGTLKKLLPDVPLILHKRDVPIWDLMQRHCEMFGCTAPEPLPPPDKFVAEGEEIAIGSARGVTLETPGHTPGGICLYFAAEKLLIAGDTLFLESYGRTDLEGGDEDTLFRSLDKLLALPPDVTVITGHGESTTIGYEKKHNMYSRYGH